MYKNYLKVAIRAFLNQKYYSIINTLGLSLGLSACILIFLYVQDELSYEHTFRDHGTIYRLVQDFPMGDHLSQSASVPFPAKQALLEDFPDITKAALLFRPSSWGNSILIIKDKDEYYEDDFVFAEPEFLDIYNFTFVSGDPNNVLSEPNELILTRTTAKKYFGGADPLGQTLNIGGFRDLKIVGVIEDLPHNTHLQFDMLCSFSTYRSFVNNDSIFETQWVWVAAWLYFTVDDEGAIPNIRGQLPEFVSRHYPPSLKEKGISLHIQQADDIHLHSSRELEFKTNGNIQHVYIFSSISILTLIIAIINFMNLATARSSKRGKEVGLRKAMGSNKEMLIVQFIGEALLTTFLALAIALFFIYNILPWYNDITGKNFSIQFFQNPWLLLGILGLLIFVGLAAGSYPALVLSSFSPTDVLKGKLMRTSHSGNILRKIMVVCQFVVSITLMISIGIVYKQLKYVHTLDLGFDKEQILLADLNFNQLSKYNSFKTDLESKPEIESITLMAGSIPGQDELIENAFIESGRQAEDHQWFSVFFASHDFEKVLDIEFLEGHSFKVGNSADSTGYIINQAAARALGWSENEIIGKSLERINSTDGTILQKGEVIGLVKDYHYRPLYDPIKPLIISLALGGSKMCLKIKSKEVKKTVAFIQDEWESRFDGVPFRFSFMDQDYDRLYAKEESLGKTVRYFSVLAIFIACLGLLGLSSFSTESRKKEIGIRKVNGASTLELLSLLTMEFSKLVLIAFFISVPVAWYFGNLWLSDFAYKTNMGITVFIFAGAAALFIAVVTVSYHTIKAAMSNPVKSLRYE
jgi:putative ABC transport system permease protein